MNLYTKLEPKQLGSIRLLEDKLSKTLDNYILYFPYFNDHGKGHSERIIKHLDDLTKNIELSSMETYILLCSAWLHDIGMANPKKKDAPDEKRCVPVSTPF